MTMDKINLSNRPLIFPKLTAYLVINGVSIKVSGKMGSDYRINSVVLKTLLTREWVNLPDVAYYDKKQQRWYEHTFDSTEATIDLGRQGEIHFSKQMYKLQGLKELETLCDFIRLNSSGDFTAIIE